MNKVPDFIIRTKNACLARRKKILIPNYKINREVGRVLVKEGFLDSVKDTKVGGKKVLEIAIKYERRKPVLTDVLIVSRPSLRVYMEVKDVSEVQKKGIYTLVLSTNKGIISGKDAVKMNIGGEVLFRIW